MGDARVDTGTVRRVSTGPLALDVECVQIDPTTVETHDVVLEDSLGRREPITVGVGTVFILVPMGTFGCLPFELVPNDTVNGKPVFRQRIILGNADVHRQVVNILENMVKHNDLQKRVVLAGGGRELGPRRLS